MAEYMSLLRVSCSLIVQSRGREDDAPDFLERDGQCVAQVSGFTVGFLELCQLRVEPKPSQLLKAPLQWRTQAERDFCSKEAITDKAFSALSSHL